MECFSFSNLKIFLFYFILIILISPIILSFSFINPYAITLKDEKILVIHKFGISICNSSTKTIINNITLFSEDEQIITEGSLSKITHSSENGYIFCIINDKIYIFNDEGIFLAKNNNKIISSTETATYYTLIPISKTYNSYYFVIGYIYNSQLNFLCYIYSFSDNSISFKFGRKNEKHYFYTFDSLNNKQFLGQYSIKNKGLSCQYLKNHRFGNVLTCFFLIYNQTNYITMDIFKVDSNTINIHSNFSPDHFNIGNVINIKSIRSTDLTTAIICLYLDTGKPIYFLYDINENYYELNGFFELDSYKCKHAYHGLKINYYEKSKEYIISCLMEDKGILTFL